jgi:hypothetical protein
MVIFQGINYDTIRRFDCISLDFGFHDGGGFCTSLPISSLHYRSKLADCDRSHSKVKITIDENFTHFGITDDYGNFVTVSVGNEHTKEIEYAISQARLQGLYA